MNSNHSTGRSQRGFLGRLMGGWASAIMGALMFATAVDAFAAQQMMTVKTRGIVVGTAILSPGQNTGINISANSAMTALMASPSGGSATWAVPGQANFYIYGTGHNPSIAGTNLTLNADGTISNGSTQTPAGSYTIAIEAAQISAPNFAYTSPEIIISEPSAISAGGDSGAGYILPTTGGTTVSVFANDSLAGAAPTASNATLTWNGSAVAGFTLNANGTITATSKPAGSYSIPYKICEIAFSTNCATATATVVIASSISATDDSYTVPAVGGTTASMFTNDLLAGVAPTSSTVSLSWNGSAVSGFTLNTNGTITVASGKAAGAYSVPYKICETTAPTSCATATATVNVQSAIIVATSDSFTIPAQGGTTASILTNDTLGGVTATYSVVQITLNGSAISGVSLGSTGFIIVNSGMAAGAYAVPYKICEIANPTNCATATATVTVQTPSQIVVNADSYTVPSQGGNTASVFVNDLLAGVAPTSSTVAISLNGSAVAGITLNSPLGTITVASEKAAGAYPVPYKICETVNPTNCATGTATVTVLAANAIVANADTYTVPPAGGTTASAFANDSLNGATPTSSTVTFSWNGVSFGGFTLNTNGTITVASGKTPGAYGLPYKICETVNPSNCATSTATVNVASAIAATNDAYTIPAQGGTTASIFANDSLAGAVPTASTVAVTWNGATVPGFTLNAAGTVTVASGKAAGAYSVPYKICETTNPTNCATATATVTVQGVTPIVANPNTFYLPTNGGTTATTIIADDTLNGVTPTTSVVTISWNGSPVSGFTINAAGTITAASGLTPTNYAIPYMICETVNPTNCSTSVATVYIAKPISLTPDTFTVPAQGGTTTSVLANDLFNGTIPNSSTSVLTTYLSVVPGFTLNANGTITVAANMTPGVYAQQYQIYELGYVTNSAHTTATVTVLAPNTIQASADSYAVPSSGGTTASMFANDFLSGIAPTVSTVSVAWNGTVVPGFTLNSNGTITVAANKTPGTYSVPYKICEAVNPTNCASTTSTVVVSNLMSATNDAFTLPAQGGTTASVFTNDLVAAAAPTSAIVSIVWNGSALSGFTLNTDGTVTVASNKPAGPYAIPYKICEKSNVTNCATAVATITINNAITATNDSYTIPYGGATTASVLTNDLLAGAVPTSTSVTIAVAAPVQGITMNANGSMTIVGTKLPGTYSIAYSICETAVSANCATATATVIVAPALIGQCLPVPTVTATQGGIVGDGGGMAAAASWSVGSQSCALPQQLYTSLSMNSDITSVYSATYQIRRVNGDNSTTPITTDFAGALAADSQFIVGGGLSARGTNVSLVPGNYVLVSSIRYTDAAITAAGYNMAAPGFNLANYTSAPTQYPFTIVCAPATLAAGGLSLNGSGQTLALLVSRSACNGAVSASVSLNGSDLPAAPAAKSTRSVSGNFIAGFTTDLTPAALADGDYTATVTVQSDTGTAQTPLQFSITNGKIIPRSVIAKSGNPIGTDAATTDSLGRIGVVLRLPASVPGIQR